MKKRSILGLFVLLCLVMTTSCTPKSFVHQERPKFSVKYPWGYEKQPKHFETEVMRFAYPSNVKLPVYAAFVLDIDKKVSLKNLPKTYLPSIKEAYPEASKFKIIEQGLVKLSDGTPAATMIVKWLLHKDKATTLQTAFVLAYKKNKIVSYCGTDYYGGQTSMGRLLKQCLTLTFLDSDAGEYDQAAETDDVKMAVRAKKTKLENSKKETVNRPPEIIISEPDLKRGIKILQYKNIRVAGRGIDRDGIYEIMVNGIEAQLQKDGHFSAIVPLKIGENSITVKATDVNKISSYKTFTVNRKSETVSSSVLKSDEKSLALVIGNGKYKHGGSLRNPINDSRSMEGALKKLGFTVIKYENCDQKSMKKVIDEFGRKLKKYDVGLFFYAGHGVQVNGNNYLIPTDARLENEQDTEYDCVRADRILAKMEFAESKTNIVILDACRDNPFERSWQRGSKGNGLAFMNAPSGSLIAYSTSPGHTASDGSGKNGRYTAALLKHVDTPGITILKMFQLVRSDVMDISDNKQCPWESTSLRGDFFFKK